MQENAPATETANAPVQSLAPTELLKQEIDQVANFYNLIIDFFSNYSFQLIGAFIIFLIGYMFAGKVAAWVLKLCEKHKLDITLSRFLANTSKMVIVILISIIALNKLGVSVTPLLRQLVQFL